MVLGGVNRVKTWKDVRECCNQVARAQANKENKGECRTKNRFKPADFKDQLASPPSFSSAPLLDQVYSKVRIDLNFSVLGRGHRSLSRTMSHYFNPISTSKQEDKDIPYLYSPS